MRVKGFDVMNYGKLKTIEVCWDLLGV
jgi:hypothetical protein